MGHDGGRKVLHVDMDAFFASVELLGREELRGRPVIVGGDPGFRSVVTSCTYEARKYGVHAGMSMTRALSLIPHAVVLSGSFARYRTYSHRVLEVLLSFTPRMHAVSIDEAFLDVSGIPGSMEDTGQRIQKAVLEATSLWCTVGCGPNRLLAKMASNLYKPRGVGTLTPEMMTELPASAIWGVGPGTASKLGNYGIDTIGKLRALSRSALRSIMGVYGEELYRYARGVDDRPVPFFGYREPPKSMGHEHTFTRDVEYPGEYMPALAMVCQRTGCRAREGGWKGGVVTLKYRLRNLKRITRRKILPWPTDQDQTILRAAGEMAAAHIKEPIRLIGVSISHLVPSETAQLSFFPEGTVALNSVADRVRERHGERAMVSGRALEYIQGKG
ncbi:MAG TPA: DNA polymerase IV [Candidatus Sabulitectum sp.]|nr:DNA polymerase IV [Candidatus Sabulitectum sp.]